VRSISQSPRAYKKYRDDAWNIRPESKPPLHTLKANAQAPGAPTLPACAALRTGTLLGRGQVSHAVRASDLTPQEARHKTISS